MGGGASANSNIQLEFEVTEGERLAFEFFSFENIHIKDLKEIYDEYKDETTGYFSAFELIESIASMVSEPFGTKAIQFFNTSEELVSHVDELGVEHEKLELVYKVY